MNIQIVVNSSNECITTIIYVYAINMYSSYFISQITGILIIGVGTTIKAIYSHFDTILEDRFHSPATLLIVIGCIVFIVAFFGCCGAVRESTCMVMVVSEEFQTYPFAIS